MRKLTRATGPIWPKLDGLERLRASRSTAFRVLPWIAFTMEEWRQHSQRILRRLETAQLDRVVAVRSCAAQEDAAPNEPPGFFESVLNVDRGEQAKLTGAIDLVCASYCRRTGVSSAAHKILVQSQLMDPAVSGVCRVGTAAQDYLEIDYDESLGRTDAVTAGLKAQRIYLSASDSDLPAPWRALRIAADAIRTIFAPPFFLEFSIDGAGVPYIFQVRSDRRPPREGYGRPPTSPELAQAETLVRSEGPLSVMADWNPAELLGPEAKPLDASLYDNLLMSGAWEAGRHKMGWRTPLSRQLMVRLGGRYYIKLRTSFESLLPAGLSTALATKLVNDRLSLLQEKPELHDKVEFRVMWSAFAFDETAHREQLMGRGFSGAEVDRLFSALRRVTRKSLAGAASARAADRAGLKSLQTARRTLHGINHQTSPPKVAAALNQALASCRAHGTIAFSRQARIAFTFRYVVNHLIESGAIPASMILEWERGLNTVARQLERDLGKLGEGTMERVAFNRRYGHLRPRSYNLESPRYDERDWLPNPTHSRHSHRRTKLPDVPRLHTILKAVGADTCQRTFWRSAADAFRARESFKFAFSALLSDILGLLGQVATWSETDRRTLRQFEIGTLIKMLRRAPDWQSFGREVRESFAVQAVPVAWCLPDLILAPVDLHVVREIDAKPTFIGAVVANGPPVVVTGENAVSASLSGAIAAIDAPDPGFDWVFAHPLAGMVTAYGGEFSHMGLRCAEFGISAALGCGQKLFETAASTSHLAIDPANGELWGDAQKLYPA